MAVAIDCLLSCRMTNAHKVLQCGLVKGHGERRPDQKLPARSKEAGMRICPATYLNRPRGAAIDPAMMASAAPIRVATMRRHAASGSGNPTSAIMNTMVAVIQKKSRVAGALHGIGAAIVDITAAIGCISDHRISAACLKNEPRDCAAADPPDTWCAPVIRWRNADAPLCPSVNRSARELFQAPRLRITNRSDESCAPLGAASEIR
jgi:hypothetical protein